MTEAEFIEKWNTESVGEWWSSNADRLFWVLSYNMPIGQLMEMAEDFLSLKRQANAASSSIELARRVERQAP